MDESKIKKLSGGNLDIDLTSQKNTDWKQDQCPWNTTDGTNNHKCAIKNISLCNYFYCIEYPDKVLCCYPNKNTLLEK